MQKIWRGMLLVLLLLLASASVAAIDAQQQTPHFFESTFDLEPQYQSQPSTSADVVIVPREGEQGDTHQIAVSGLQPNESITIRIVADATGEQVYSSTRNAAQNGRVQVDIFTTNDDEVGSYTVEVVNSAGDVIGTGSFTVVEAAGLEGSMSITPEAAAAGSTHVIEISGVRPFLDMEIVVLNEVDERVYTTAVRSNVDGEATVEYTSTLRDGGTYEVVVRAGETQVASGTIVVEGPAVMPEVSLLPEEVNPGDDVIVSVSGLEAEEVVTVIVTRSGSAIETVGETADVNGNVIFLLDTANAEPGIYDVRVISAQGVTLAQTSYTVLGGNIRLVITPEQAPVTNMFVFAVSGLEGSETVTVQLLDENGQVVLEREFTSDATGTAVLLLNNENGLVPGSFTARLLRDGAAIAQQQIVVEAVEGVPLVTPTVVPTTQATIQPTSQPTAQAATPATSGEANISIEPTTGAIPTSYTIAVTGVEPGSNLTVQIRYQGNVIYSVDGLAGNNGTFQTSVASEPSDPVGEYTVEVVQDGTVLDSANFSIAASDAQPQPTQAQSTQVQPTQPAASGDVTITVTPPNVAAGGIFDVRVDGLEPNSEVILSILFQNSTVYSTTRTAGSDGSLTINLQTDGTETPGTYTVTVTQNGTQIASQDFTIGETDSAATTAPTQQATQVQPTQPPSATGDVQITINPPAGEHGTDYVITVTGLNPNETVQFDLLFGGTSVYNTERTADATGSFSITLTSQEGDPSGAYQARVLRDGQVLATAELTVTETSAIQPQPTQVPTQVQPTVAQPTQPPAISGTGATVTVEPPSGTVGTSHTITVSGLTPNTNVTLEVRYNGSAVFSTSRTSDAMGNVILTLSSSPGDSEGTYTVVVLENGTQVATGDFVVGTGGGTTQPQPTQVQPTQATQPQSTPATGSGATVTVEPQSGAVGTAFTITVSGLDSNTNVTLEVRFNNSVVFTTSRTSDVMGNVVLNLTSEQGDPEGTYTVVVLQDGVQLASGDFVVGTGGSTTQPQPTQPPAATGGVTVTIDPQSGAVGTTHNITVTGLAPNSNVTLEVRFNGSSVFSTNRTADASGTALLAIASDPGDPEGTYTVIAIQNGAEVGSGDFVVGTDAGQPPAATSAPTQPVTPTDGVNVTVEPPSGAIGTAHTITISGLEPNETVTIDVAFGGASVFSTTRTADATGSASLTLTSESGDGEGQYTVTVLRESAAIATATFNVGQAVAPTPAPTQATDDGTTVDESITGSLTTNEPQYEYRFTADAGTAVVIRLSSPDFDTYLHLQDNNGNILMSNDDGAGSLDSQIGPFALPYSGEYVVVATSFGYVNFGEASTGTFTLTVESVVLNIPTIDFGGSSQSISERLTSTAPSVNITFTGQEGEQVLISLDSADFDTYLVLQDDTGSELISNDDSRNSFNSRIGPYTLPYSGSYTIVATSYGFRNSGDTVSGQFNLRLERITSATTTYGTTSTVNLSSASSAQILSFDAQAGDVISVVVNGDIDTVLEITDPGGFTVLTDDDGGQGFNPEVSRYVVPISGTYSLLVSSFTPSDTGTVQVTLNRDDVRSLDTETRTVRLNSKQSSDILTLQGIAGSRINLNVVLLNGEIGNMTITVRQGDAVLMTYQTFGMPTDVALGFEVVDDAPVSVIVTDEATGGATLEFSITYNQS